MRRLLLLTLLTPVLCLPVLAGPPASALPCPPPPQPLGRQLSNADHVFTGQVTAVERGQDEWAYDVTVQRVYQGSGIVEHVTLYGPATIDDCRLVRIQIGQEWLFVASGRADHLTTQANAGTSRWNRDLQRTVENRLGRGEEPDPDPVEPPATAELTNVADDGPEEFWPLSLPGFALVGLGLVVLAGARGLSRRADRQG
jgi:hypothetical protein